MTSIRISLARPSDAAAIARMSRHLIETDLPWSWTEERVRNCVKHPECAVIVARDGRRTAGFAIMDFLEVHAHLCLLAVHPSYRQQGVGTDLIRWLEASARTAGVFLVRLELRAGNRAAKTFYENLGYQEAGTRKAYYAGVEDALQMTHDLSVVSAPRS